MKQTNIVLLLVVSVLYILVACSKDGNESETIGQRNAHVLRDVLDDHEIHFVSVYVFNHEINDWESDFSNDTWDNNNEQVTYRVEDHFFVIINEPDNFEQYFKLEYLERIGLVENDERLELYFIFP